MAIDYVRWAMGIGLATTLAACSGGNETGDAAPAEGSTSSMANSPVSDSAFPPTVAQCKTCHTFEQGGRHGVGPNLWNVHGQPAAAQPGYTYSPALLESGIVWDNAALDAYLENPRALVPGGKMSFAGLRDPEDRGEVIAYLATLTEQ